MNYYEETLLKIKEKIDKNELQEAIKLIENELDAPYLPKDFEEEIKRIYGEIRPANSAFSISEDDIGSFLRDSKEKQLLAVDWLNKQNLRNYIYLCNEYLTSDAYINAKVLLVDSLIRQEIGEEIRMENEGMEYEFIPKYLLPVEESDGFLSGSRYINEVYMKEPSKIRIALDLLYKEAILSLPLNLDEEEGIIAAERIVEYVDKAFEG